MTTIYSYTRDLHDDSGRPRTATTTVHIVTATVDNRPPSRDCVLVAWDRAGRNTRRFGDTTRTINGRTLRWDDWANPDDYWADGKFWQWHADLSARCGHDAVACLVIDNGRLVPADAFSLADFTAVARAIDTDGHHAVGLAVTAPGLCDNADDWNPAVQVCEDALRYATHRADVWCHGTLYEIRQRVDHGDETVVLTSYSDDRDWVMTQARLAADRSLEPVDDHAPS